MAISIDWGQKIINIPRADMTLVQSTPTEIRELDLNVFRLDLKALEAGDTGMAYPITHNHVQPIAVGGVTLARVIEIVNDYTITFEDGQYAVNLTGANSNVGDRVNVNQVSVRSANSAGLVQTSEIEYATFQNMVWVDPTSNTSGTAYPTGTPLKPVGNMADALLIADFRGFTTFHIMSSMVIDSNGDYEDMTFIGSSETKTIMDIHPNANVFNAEFFDATITGTLDGNAKVEHCRVQDLTFVAGFIEQCVIEGTVVLGGNADAHFLDCWSGVPGVETPVIDMGGSGQALALRNYNGGIELRNKNGAEPVSIDLNSGQVIIDNSVTNGTILLRGVGKWTNESTYTGGANVINELVEGKQLQDTLTTKKFLALK